MPCLAKRMPPSLAAGELTVYSLTLVLLFASSCCQVCLRVAGCVYSLPRFLSFSEQGGVLFRSASSSRQLFRPAHAFAAAAFASGFLFAFAKRNIRAKIKGLWRLLTCLFKAKEDENAAREMAKHRTATSVVCFHILSGLLPWPLWRSIAGATMVAPNVCTVPIAICRPI